MAEKKENIKEIAVYTVETPAMAAMLVEKLSGLDIPARLGSESAGAGVFGIPGYSRTILVPEKFASKARNILKSGK
jgi:hypothetical protein